MTIALSIKSFCIQTYAHVFHCRICSELEALQLRRLLTSNSRIRPPGGGGRGHLTSDAPASDIKLKGLKESAPG